MQVISASAYAPKGDNLVKIKKTPQDKRLTYTYVDANGNTITLYPGKDGVTEADIKRLHAFDDAKVYQNLKTAHRYIAPDEKAAMTAWRKEHPGEPEPASWQLWNTPLDSVCGGEDDAPDKNRLALRAWEITQKDAVSPRVESVREFIATLSDYQQTLYRLYFIEGMKQSEIADELQKGRPAICRALDRLGEAIRKNCR